MKCCLVTTSIRTGDWFIGTYSVRQVDVDTDDVAMLASPVFGGPLVHLVKVSISTFGPRGALTAGTWGREPRTEEVWSLNVLSLGPEDWALVYEHLDELMHAGKLEMPKHSSYQRYRHDQLEPVEEWFTEPKLAQLCRPPLVVMFFTEPL